jgi:hypothetical protein
MSNLLKEALIEAKKLREMAAEDAKKKILEDISPLINKAISDQINEDVSQSYFLEDGNEELPTDVEAPVAGGVEPTPAPEDVTVGDVSAAPLSAKGQENVMSATMPGQDGKITVDFEDLFSTNDPVLMGGDTAPESLPAPISPEPEADMGGEMELNVVPTKENFERSLSDTVVKINEAFYSESITVLNKENLQQKLFHLLENLDYLKEKNVFSKKEATKNENKLEFLFLKLKEAKVSNSYIENNQRDNNMKSLKEYAARLFEEDSSYAGAGDKDKLNHKSTASDEHAKKQSGVSPEVGGTADLKAATEKQNAKAPAEKQWAEGEATVKEEVEAKGASGFGDGEAPAVEFDVDEAELNEAIAALTGKPEKDKGWEEGEPEKVDPAHKNLKEDVGDDLMGADPLAGGDDMGVDADMGADLGAGEPDLVLNIDLPDELEAALANLDLSTIGVEVDAPAGEEPAADVGDVADGLAPEVDSDVDADLDLDLDGDSEEVESDEIVESKEPEVKEEKGSKDQMKEAFIALLKKTKMLEAKLAKAESENKALKESSTKDRDALK